MIERFLAVAGDPRSAAAQLRALAKDAGVKLEPALDLFDSRAGFIAGRGVALERIRFSTARRVSRSERAIAPLFLPVATSATGVKSRMASYGMVRLKAGVIANVMTVVISV